MFLFENIFILSLTILILHVNNSRQQIVPSLSTLHYIHTKYPIMKLKHCMETFKQCRLFASCNGIYLHIKTGKCFFDDSEQLTVTKYNTTKVPATSQTAEEQSASTATSSVEVQNITTVETTTEEQSVTTTAISSVKAQNLTTAEASTEAHSVTTTAISAEVISTKQLLAQEASSTTSVEATTTTTDIITTTNSTINYTTVTVGNTEYIVEQIAKAIYFEQASVDHEIYTQLFDTSELSTCFWMKLKETNKCGILSIFQVPVASQINCNDFMLMADSETVFFLKNQGTKLSNREVIATTRFERMKQYHICFGWNVTKAVFYVNGRLDSWHNTHDDTKLTANRYVIGNDLGGGSSQCLLWDAELSCIGKFYRLNIWNRFLTEHEMESVYNGSLPLSNLIVTWDDILNFTQTDAITKTDPFVVD